MSNELLVNVNCPHSHPWRRTLRRLEVGKRPVPIEDDPSRELLLVWNSGPRGVEIIDEGGERLSRLTPAGNDFVYYPGERGPISARVSRLSHCTAAGPSWMPRRGVHAGPVAPWAIQKSFIRPCVLTTQMIHPTSGRNTQNPVSAVTGSGCPSRE